jgi:hypothetical protein
LGLKTKVDGLLVVWHQNHLDSFSWFGLKTSGRGFLSLGLKITVTVSWFVPQNQAGYDLSVVPQNRQKDEDGMRHVSRSSGLLHMEASQARIFKFVSKLAEA